MSLEAGFCLILSQRQFLAGIRDTTEYTVLIRGASEQGSGTKVHIQVGQSGTLDDIKSSILPGIYRAVGQKEVISRFNSVQEGFRKLEPDEERRLFAALEGR